MRESPAVRACHKLATGNVALPVEARRDRLRCGHQRMREGPAVETGLEFAAGDVDLPADAGRDQLQLRDQRLREGPAVGAGLELVAGDVDLPSGAGRIRAVPCRAEGSRSRLWTLAVVSPQAMGTKEHSPNQ